MAKRRKKGGRRTGVAGLSLHARGLALWAAALAIGILCVWQHVYASNLAAEIERLRESREALGAEIGFLEMECVSLSARQRIERYATERLGMRYPRAGEVQVIEEERAAGAYVPGERYTDVRQSDAFNG